MFVLTCPIQQLSNQHIRKKKQCEFTNLFTVQLQDQSVHDKNDTTQNFIYKISKIKHCDTCTVIHVNVCLMVKSSL